MRAVFRDIRVTHDQSTCKLSCVVDNVMGKYIKRDTIKAWEYLNLATEDQELRDGKWEEWHERYRSFSGHGRICFCALRKSPTTGGFAQSANKIHTVQAKRVYGF